MTDQPNPPRGVVIVFGCLCSDSGESLDDLPDRCPGHDKPRTGTWINRTRPGTVKPGHYCPSDHRCEGARQ